MTNYVFTFHIDTTGNFIPSFHDRFWISQRTKGDILCYWCLKYGVSDAMVIYVIFSLDTAARITNIVSSERRSSSTDTIQAYAIEVPWLILLWNSLSPDRWPSLDNDMRRQCFGTLPVIYMYKEDPQRLLA